MYKRIPRPKKSTIVTGYKGKSDMDAGFIYAPYIPLPSLKQTNVQTNP